MLAAMIGGMLFRSTPLREGRHAAHLLGGETPAVSIHAPA